MTKEQRQQLADLRYESAQCELKMRELQVKRAELRIEELECRRRGEIVTDEWRQDVIETDKALQQVREAQNRIHLAIDRIYDEIENS